jgi:hypothetical protein
MIILVCLLACLVRLVLTPARHGPEWSTVPVDVTTAGKAWLLQPFADRNCALG